MNVTVIEPDGAVWITALRDDCLGQDFFCADHVQLAVPFDYEHRITPTSTKVKRYEGYELKTKDRSYWIYVQAE